MLDKEQSLSNRYSFMHVSGVRIIAQNASEFYFMQGAGQTYNKDNTSGIRPELITTKKDGTMYFDGIRRHSEIRLAYKEWKGFYGHTQYVSEVQIDKFWVACKDYAVLKNKYMYYNGYLGCPIKRFLANIINDAIMIGDIGQYEKASLALNTLFGNQLQLPAHS
jgi:hypothetical protein